MFTIGADPEFFITVDGGASVLPIIGLLGGTKEKPIAIGDNGFAVQEDNVMAEYNVPPVADPHSFADVVVRGRQYAIQRLRKALPGVQAYQNCAAFLPEPLLAHPQAQTFGCSPDFNAYEQGAPLPRIQPEQLTGEGGAWRFAGGHVHLGYRDELGWECPEFVVATLCDLLIGLPAIVHGMDEQGVRRQFYGSPGRYRPTRYGIEYRTLGNTWTMSARSALHVGSMAFSVFRVLNMGEKEVRRIYNEMPWTDVRRAIATADGTLAYQLRDYASDYGVEIV